MSIVSTAPVLTFQAAADTLTATTSVASLIPAPLAGAVGQGARWNATMQAAIVAVGAVTIVACAIRLFV